MTPEIPVAEGDGAGFVPAFAARRCGNLGETSLRAAETARLARRISSRWRDLPERDAFLRTVRLLEATALETFYSLEFARLLFKCHKTPRILQWDYSNGSASGVNCFEEEQENSWKTASCGPWALIRE